MLSAAIPEMSGPSRTVTVWTTVLDPAVPVGRLVVRQRTVIDREDPRFSIPQVARARGLRPLGQARRFPTEGSGFPRRASRCVSVRAGRYPRPEHWAACQESFQIESAQLGTIA
jgi:hypothetical protein